MVEIDEFLQQRLENGRLVRLHTLVKQIRIRIDLVAASVEIRRVRRHTRQQIQPQSAQERVNGGRIQLQLARRRFGSVGVPVRLDVERCDQVRVRQRDGSGMTRHVRLDGDLDAAVGGVFLNRSQDGRAVGKTLHVCSGGCEGGQGWDFQRPGLGVGGVEMEAVEFVPCESVDGAHDVGGGVVSSRDIQVEASVGELGCIRDEDGRAGDIDASGARLV